MTTDFNTVPAKYEGKLISTSGERNGYHDSYWYAHIWCDETNAPQEITTGTTAAGGEQWRPDRGIQSLTDENRAKYEAYKTAQAEKRRAELEIEAAEFGLTGDEYTRLREGCGVDLAAMHSFLLGERNHPAYRRLHACERLLKTKKFRSDFRKSLAEQIREWVKSETPDFPAPLSPRQFSFIA